MEIELKPCPFCGGRAEFNKHREPYCTRCHATMPGAKSFFSVWNYEEYLTNLWNQRVVDKKGLSEF